jgi:archaemetzincin
MMKGKIVIVPLGESDFVELNRLAAHLAQVFSCAVDILSGARIPEEAYSPIRGQYFAMVLLQKLELLKSGEREKILALVDEDMFTPDRAWVIGASDRIGGTSVISTHRLRQEYFGYDDEDQIVYYRTCKETVHQLGHLFGMRSCRNPRCAMYSSERMQDIDEKREKFCDNCLRRIGQKV